MLAMPKRFVIRQSLMYGCSSAGVNINKKAIIRCVIS
jgi:hypothetical protein